ncbi:methyltransferase domain-containing protein [Ewingella americana]|uniref:tRNA1(Val) (adenine(37)-N6)-methyltransferase n=1 Tax=Ewingella americana TaxID=41202 RepID=A0A502GPJ1_9GAMM|nr:methyltransferase [Ewingella americana]TPG64257.1 methyltransferase domain-containing protein [Ewingella americana]
MVITVNNVVNEVSVSQPLRRNGFTFKQFFVAHDRCAMKVGTDGVLLGAWASVEQASCILDIGSGSGLIALMLAQRTPSSVMIDAAELDLPAAEQAKQNFEASPWAKRLNVFAQDINVVAQTHPAQYDLIVSNPPYFESAVACRDEARNTARYTQTLTHSALLKCAEKLLMSRGVFCVVLPYELGLALESNAHQQGWFTVRRLAVRDRPGKVLNRLLLALSRQPAEADSHELDLREREGVYSPAFRALIADFYLNY